MKPVRKAVITAAGYATRFLPITKAVPKEMLPLGDKPVIHYILEELEHAGIKEVLILIGRGRECLLNYIDKNYEVDDHLEKVSKKVNTNFFSKLDIYFRRVPLPKGVADCVKHAQSFIGDNPFILAYCDDVFFDGNPSKEMISQYSLSGNPCISASRVPYDQASKYGIITKSGLIIEKPKVPETNLVAVGRYLLPSKFFNNLGDDMIAALNSVPNKGIIETKAKRFDAGNKEGLFQAFQYIMSQNSIL